jgi:hypothetical protein
MTPSLSRDARTTAFVAPPSQSRGRIRLDVFCRDVCDVQSGEFSDSFKAGIVDSTEVTRLVLENAASVTSAMLCTQALVAQIPADEAESRASDSGRKTQQQSRWTANGVTVPLARRQTPGHQDGMATARQSDCIHHSAAAPQFKIRDLKFKSV